MSSQQQNSNGLFMSKPEIDIGLTALCKHAPEGHTLTAQDIADVCGCTRNLIYDIEHKAINKLRANGKLKDYEEYITA